MQWSIASENLAYAMEKVWKSGEWDGDLVALYRSKSCTIYFLYDRPANLYWQVVTHDDVHGPSVTLIGNYERFTQFLETWFGYIDEVSLLTIEPIDDGYLIKFGEFPGLLYLYDTDLLQHLAVVASVLNEPTPLIEGETDEITDEE